MKKMMRRMAQAVITVAAVMLLVLACDMPAQAFDDGGFKEEVKAYADLFRVGDADRIAEGVTIAGLDVGGMTLMEVVDAVQARQEAMHAAKITLTFGEKNITYTMEEFGLSVQLSAEEVVKAACLGKSGSLVERYKATADIANGGHDILSEQSAKEGIIADRIAGFAGSVNIPALEATISRNGNSFTVTQEESGLAVDENDLMEQVLAAVKNWNGEDSITLQAKGMALEPKYTAEMLSTIQDCLGQYVTDCGNLNSNRGQNILVAAEKLDGVVILPGESLSVVDMLTPFSVENGYVEGNQYVEGRYELSIGGGVCLVSSTLYNVLLKAELQIDKRWNHSMTVGYMPYGFDSTVNDEGTRDLVFTNDTDYPIYIETYAEKTPVMGHWLHIELYGTETRDTSRREIKFYNNVLVEEFPTRDEFTFNINWELEPGEEVWVQDNYPYVVVEAYKEVWVDGKLVSKELLHTDTYSRSPAIIEYNPTEPETEEPETETGEPETGEGETDGTPTEAPTEEVTEGEAEASDGLIVYYPSN